MSNELLNNQGGSYEIDPDTQTLRLVERTKTQIELQQEAEQAATETTAPTDVQVDKKVKGK